MRYAQASLEAHDSAASVYLAGFLCHSVAACTSDFVAALGAATRIIRVDLSATDAVDPNAFTAIVSILSSWRDRSGGTVVIHDPRTLPAAICRSFVTRSSAR